MKLLNLEQLATQEVDALLAADREAQALEEQDRLSQRFDARFEKRSWLERYLPRRRQAQRISLACHLVSGSGAAYAFFLLFGVLVWGWLGGLLAMTLIFFHEREKRRWSDRFWDIYYSQKGKIAWLPLSINASLFLVSLAITVGGAYFGLKDNMPGADIMGHSDDPNIVALQDQLAQANADLQAFEDNPSNYTSKGEVYYKRLDTWSALQAAPLAIEQQLRDQYGVFTVSNEHIISEWLQRRGFVISLGVFLCLLCEFVFEYNMAFRSKYDYRLYLARELLQAAKAKSDKEALPQGQKINGGSKKEPALVS